MDLITGIKERRSIRKFQDKKVPRELLEEIVNISAYAPSWKNTQIARYIIVDDEKTLKALANEKCAYGFKGNVATMEAAPALLLLTFVEGRSGFERDGSYSTKKKTDGRCLTPALQPRLSVLPLMRKGWVRSSWDISTRKK